MTETRFWEIIGIVNWGKDFDYDRIKSWMLKHLTPENAEEFRKIAREKWDAIDKMVGDRCPAQGADDSHSDLFYHVIGLGKEVYEASLENYYILEERGQAPYGSPEGYKESFLYAIPHQTDYDMAIEEEKTRIAEWDI